MKIIELRIGNIVGFKNRDDCYCVVTDLSSAGGIHLIREFYDGYEDDQPEVIEDITPIPLTEEWLLTFGFKRVDINCQKKEECDWEIDMNRTLDLCYEPDEPSHYWPTIYDKMEIRYVHQLQNLYFSLTGEELTILNTL